MTWSDPVPDILGDDWSARTLDLGDGAVATLVHRATSGTRSRAMVYLHGFTDYFFQAQHAAEWEARGYDVYALDLRDCGRSIRPGRQPHWITDLRDYDAELDAAFAHVRTQGHDAVVLNGHSTGGLIAALYAHDHPGAADALVLNSPWFDLNSDPVTTLGSVLLLAVLRRADPHRQVANLGDAYGRSLHVSTGGEWDYDLVLKPLAGFPVQAGWLAAIRDGHARIAAGTAIVVPVLVATSGRRGRRGHPTAADLAGADCVLDPADMWRLAPRLGPKVRVLRVPGGRHDLTLSLAAVRERYSAAMFTWLERVLPH